MRLIFLMLVLAAPCVAQETPTQSYQAFVDAVLDTELGEEERTAVFEKYFDFGAWLADHTAETGKTFDDEQVAELRANWFEVFASQDFRETYEARDVRILEEAAREDEAGTAELTIAMNNADGTTDKFRVLMTLSDDAEYWRWYSIPQIEEVPIDKTATERLKEVEEMLAAIEEARAQLDERERELREELRKLRAEITEDAGGESDYATPQSVVEAAWQAIEEGDVDALLDSHLVSRVAQAEKDRAKLEARIAKTRERLMSWEIVDSVFDSNDDTRATVRVRLKLQRTGEADTRTISVRVQKSGDDWKIDEEP